MSLGPGTRLVQDEIVRQSRRGGGMAEVWKAQDLRLRRQAAIKELPAMHHPGLEQVFGAGGMRGASCVAMEPPETERGRSPDLSRPAGGH